MFSATNLFSLLTPTNIAVVWLFVFNLIALFAMGLDKHRARKNKWRIRERALFLLAVFGGSIGAIFGMLLFRHKTRHRSFVIGMPIILVLQIVIIALLHYYFL